MASADRESPDDDAVESHADPIARVGVLGLWHLGSVTAACLAESGLDVVGVDPDAALLADLAEDRPPVAEPGLAELLAAGTASGRLTFARPSERPLGEVDAVWIAFDTPVDDEDRADSEWVIAQARASLLHARHEALVIVSSQLPVGSTSKLAERLARDGRDDLRFACVPENLRLGEALATFGTADRFVAGVSAQRDRDELAPLLRRFTEHVQWMGVESAEMTKHALNAFLATSVAFINEIGSLCEVVGADASEVTRGLKSDLRIGPRAYLSAGDAFAGGTLARDLEALGRLAASSGVPAELIAGVGASNRSHRAWSRRALLALLEGEGSPNVAGAAEDGEALSLLDGRRIAVWGLTYKPGTDTLRRSAALELCAWLHEHSASVRAHDPAVRALPDSDAGKLELCSTPLDAVQDADALVLCTPWPEYREVDPDELVAAMRTPIVIDAGGHLRANVTAQPAIRYARAGRSR